MWSTRKCVHEALGWFCSLIFVIRNFTFKYISHAFMQKDRCVTRFLFRLLFTQSHALKETKRNRASGSTVTPGKNRATGIVWLKASLQSTKGPHTSYVHARIRQLYTDGTQEKLVEKKQHWAFFNKSTLWPGLMLNTNRKKMRHHHHSTAVVVDIVITKCNYTRG